jgi:hypothetical protein
MALIVAGLGIAVLPARWRPAAVRAVEER